jgi:rhodanese-related sulfurtransferase
LLTPAVPPPPLPTSIPLLTLPPTRSLLTPAVSSLSIPATAAAAAAVAAAAAASTPAFSTTQPRRTQHAPAPDAAEYTQLSPSQLPPILSQQTTLILDIRPYAHFLASRLPNAISLNVPSILLKRPGTDWSKITAGITEPAALERFSRWRSAATLLIVDPDTTTLAECTNLLGLLRKFRIAGYSGTLSWLKGGMAALCKLPHSDSILERGPIRSAAHTADTADAADNSTHDRVLCPRDLPIQAFQDTSTTMLHQSTPSRTQSSSFTSFTAANPFYDTIRQNVELADGVGDKIPLLVSDYVFSRRHDLPFQWFRDLLLQAESPDHGAETLALQFYRIEVGEQRRLQGIMSHHSRQNPHPKPIHRPSTAPAQFPFSITAGIEMGTKNRSVPSPHSEGSYTHFALDHRYRNIWPFEHARVRLRTISASDGSDYVNASYVQPMVTKRRYIATQGPLPTTFIDFWTSALLSS